MLLQIIYDFVIFSKNIMLKSRSNTIYNFLNNFAKCLNCINEKIVIIDLIENQIKFSN